ncbi:MAG: acetoin utilization protein AcuC [Anaerolineaceae bacterium]|nr:acetoin utilization protein AcuC [Anaerolineaceae bacterium]
MKTHKAAFIHSSELEQYPYPPECPLDTSRAGMVHRILTSMEMLSGPDRTQVAPETAPREAVQRFHSPEYLDLLERAGRGRTGAAGGLHMGLGTPDCPVFLGLYDYAMLACGATLTGCRMIADGRATVVFNPSGGYHHARPSLAAGFCYINDAAIACLTLADQGRRVLYLDLDAHHGDGVEAAVYDRPEVMTISLHENGRTLFPGTGFEGDIGLGAGKGYAVNVPLPVGTYDGAYLRAFEALAVPLMGAFDPDVIILELGLDGLADDPLTHLSLTNNVYVEVIRRVLGFDTPLLAVGGGGYHVQNTARGWALAWGVMCGQPADESAGARLGALRDRALTVDDQHRKLVDPAIAATIAAVKRNVFRHHGL